LFTLAHQNRTHRNPKHSDSKLTRFLQPALEGNALIAIICSISASTICLDETHNTLKVGKKNDEECVTIAMNELLYGTPP
jgi:centromeric protein E